MMIIQWVLLILSLVQIQALNHRFIRQVTSDSCAHPGVTFCDFVECENGQCVEDKASSACFQCQCNAGFTGRLCETALTTSTGCNPNCQNGGQCEQTGATTFVCNCPSDFTGSQCETPLLATHPCITMPATVCQNGGTCAIDGSGYLCSCPTGWTGANCETQTVVSQCEANTCGAHGICIQAVTPTGPIVICNCENRWTGKFCDVNLDACPSGFCLSGGVCSLIGNIPTCQCPPTHTGIRCETLVGTVTPITGTTMTTTTMTTMTTTSSSTTTTTMTTTGSTGITQVPGDCSSSPCLNGGSCYDTGNSFICLCHQSYSGPTCSIPSLTTTTPSNDACSSNPCSNGGSCYKHPSVGFICLCTSAFTGPTCTQPKTTTTLPSITTNSTTVTCQNQPCQNGGICYDTGNSYFCYCGSKNTFTGQNCETPVASITTNCPLNCSPGYCVRTGNALNAHACMCNGILNPTSC